MSAAERIMDVSDQTFAPRDILALLAYIVDMRGIGAAELAGVAADLGLATTVDFNPELHADTGGQPGDRLTYYNDALIPFLNIGRERLAARFAIKKH